MFLCKLWTPYYLGLSVCTRMLNLHFRGNITLNTINFPFSFLRKLSVLEMQKLQDHQLINIIKLLTNENSRVQNFTFVAIWERKKSFLKNEKGKFIVFNVMFPLKWRLSILVQTESPR
jgi:hypothetical protein